jgi:uncharacterized membrane protein
VRGRLGLRLREKKKTEFGLTFSQGKAGQRGLLFSVFKIKSTTVSLSKKKSYHCF